MMMMMMMSKVKDELYFFRDNNVLNTRHDHKITLYNNDEAARVKTYETQHY